MFVLGAIAIQVAVTGALIQPVHLNARLASTPPISRHAPVHSTESHKEAVIVGGGPAGLASAWILANRGFEVTLLERRTEPNPYEPQRAYLYLVDGRGQQFTDFAGITDDLSAPAFSVSSLNYTVTRCLPDGERVEAKPPILEGNDDGRRPSYWIPRSAFLGLLTRALPSSVRIIYGSEVCELRKTSSGGVEVVARTADAGAEVRLRPDLLVGADGLNSMVRAKCAEWCEASLEGGSAKDFEPTVLPSPSSGLQYKMLRFPPAFALDAQDVGATAEPRKAYSIRPATEAPLGPTRLGLLPVADPTYPRTANVILPPGHPVWDLKTASAVRGWLTDTFPSLPVDQVLSDTEANAFAAEAPGSFPAPQYSPKQFLVLPDAGICLVGDAVHAFPPVRQLPPEAPPPSV